MLPHTKATGYGYAYFASAVFLVNMRDAENDLLQEFGDRICLLRKP
jgi:hypothetical protein